MSAVINTKEKNLGMEYLRRTAGYISGAVGSYISDAMPVTTNTLRDAKQTVTDVNSAFAHTTQSILPKARELRRQIGFKNISDWFNQKEDEFSTNHFDDAELAFDIPVDDVSTEAEISQFADVGNKISKAVIESTHKSVEAQMEATANLTTSVSDLTAVVSAGFDQTNNLLSKMLEMLSKNTATLIEVTASNQKSNPEQDMVSSGKFNLNDYKKIVTSNIKNSEVGMAATLLPLLLNPDMIKDSLRAEELIKNGIAFGINKMSPNLKKNMKALDEAVSDTIMDSLIRLGEDKGFGTRGLLGRIFGIDSSRKTIDTSRSKLELKSVPYDTISKEALTNTIPGYLRQILVAVGGPDMVYDYRSRSFKTKAALRREFHDAASTGGSLWGASDHIRSRIDTSKFNQMSYDLMINDLGSKTTNGQGRRQVNKFTNYNEAEDYVLNILYGGQLSSEQDIAAAKAFARSLSRIDPGKLHDITNQVAKSNINRNKRMSQYVRNADQFNVDLSEFTDTTSEISKAIQEAYGRGDLSSRSGNQSETELRRGEPTLYSAKGLSGVNYTNIALYEIYRRLNEGINVFKTGESKKPLRTPYPKWGDERLPRPKDYKPKQGSTPPASGEETSTLSDLANRDPDDPNLLRNQVLEDGSEENLTRGQRLGRWGKKRGGDLAHAIFAGDPDQVRAAFGAIVGDVSQVAGDGIKEGISKINDSFGNVSGYLKHKMFGTEYTYTDKDENGNPVTKVVEKNEGGGIFGFVNRKFSSMFDKASESGSKWFKTVAGYFDYGDKDESSDVKSKRKRLINTSVGALAGAGILGGPMGLIMGAVAGNALSATGIGDKIKGLLFGRDKNGKAKGLLTRVGDSIVDPIRYQIGKSVEHVGNILKKNILGPLSDIGAAIHDRITSTASSTFGKVFSTIGKIILAPFKGIANTLIGAAKFPITLAGNLFRGITGVESGMAGGAMNILASGIAGKNSTHKIKHEDGTVEEISTREWLKRRRKERADDVKSSKAGSKYRNYKTWKAQAHAQDAEDLEDLRESMSETVRDYDPEKDGTSEIKEDTSEIKDIAERQAEDTAEIKDSVGKMAEEALTKGSLYTHDDGLHNRVDRIIELLGGTPPTSSENSEETPENSGDDNNVSLAELSNSTPDSVEIPNGIKSDKEKKKEENANYGTALFSSGATLADEGGVDDRDVNTLEKMANGIDGSETKSSMFQRFRDLLGRNQDKADDRNKIAEKEEESFLSKLISGIGSVAGGLLSKGWPLILAGLTLFSDKFRELLFGEDGLLRKAGTWLLNNLPDIIKTAWQGIKDVAEDVNREIENHATGATTVVDPVTGEEKSVMSAETHAARLANGIFNSAVDTTLNPIRLGKDALIMAGERTVLRTGAGIISAGGGLVSAGGGLANLGVKGIQSVTNGAKSFLGNTIFKGTSTGLRLTSEAATSAVTGSTAAQTVAEAGATVGSTAGGFKSMMGKITDLKTWINPKAVGNILGGIASDVSAGIGWESAEMAKNGNIVGDYGLGNAGGFVQTSTTAKTITTTTIGLAGGIAIGQAVSAAAAAVTAAGGLAAAGTANFWNPIGWCALIIAGVLAASAGIAALVNMLVGIATDNADKDYAVRSNASKLKGVIEGSVSYTNGAENPMYVYCGQESDRVLGLTKGLNVKDPDLMFGKFLRQIADGLVSSPGTEVLLYDLINNMAVQGVPFAVLVAGDSKEAKCDGAHANKNTTGTPPTNRVGPLNGQYCTVKKSTVKKHNDEVFADIAANIGRQDKTAIFTEDNLKYVYDAGKDVVKALKKNGILSEDGKVQTKKFKGSPGDKSNAEGWSGLDKICRDEGSYFLTKCLVYINSKIEANKSGQQWIEARQDDIVKLLDGLKDFFKKEGDAAVKNMRSQGMSDDQIEKALTDLSDPKGTAATPAADTAPADTAILKDVSRKTGLSGTDKKKIATELSYISAAYAYSHPDYLQSWVKKHQSQSGVNVDNVNQIANWKNAFSGDKRKQKTLRSEMITASLKFAESAGDIFGLLDKFDWSSGGKILGSKNYSSLGAAFPLRGLGGMWGANDTKKDGKSELDAVFNSTDPSGFTPLDVHKKLFGKEAHGKASESKTTSGQDATVPGSGQIAQVAEAINYYGSSAGNKLTQGNSSKGWRNALVNMPAYAPPNLPAGGPEEENAAPSGGTEGFFSKFMSGFGNNVGNTFGNLISGDSENAVVKEGGNPLNKPFSVTSYFGPRKYPHTGTHHGVDLIPSSGSGPTLVGSRFNGVVTGIKNNVSDSDRAKKNSNGTWYYPGNNPTGNMVTIQTDSGITVKNMHLKAGSIPSNIKEGTRVGVGDLIGTMGTTGWSTGDHLHYQLEKNGVPFDPLSSVKDGETMSNFSSSGYTTEGAITDGSIISEDSTTDSNSSGFAKLLEILKSAGLEFLNKITGGLFGASASTTSNGAEMNYGSVYNNIYGSALYPDAKVKDVDEFLSLVRKEIGTKEQPANSNNVKYNTWYHGSKSSYDGLPWCLAFVQWCFNEAGLTLECHTAKCSSFLEYYQKNHPDLVFKAGTGTPKPGDIAIFGNPDPTHTGIIESVSSNSSITTIEGNTSSDDKGSQDNGGCVARKKRQTPYFTYYIRAVNFDNLKASVTAIGEGADAMFQYLKSIGYSDEAAAAVVGCWEHESTNRPMKVEWDRSNSFKSTVKTYDNVATDRAALDQHTLNLFAQYKRQGKKINQDGYKGSDGHYYPGLGYAQWTGGRGQKLLDFSKQNGVKWYDAGTQLAFMNHELQTSYKDTYNKLMAARDITSATRAFAYGYEHGSMSDSSYQARLKSAKSIYNKFRGTGAAVGGPTSELSNSNFEDIKKLSSVGVDPNLPVGGPEDSSGDTTITSPSYSKPNVSTPKKKITQSSSFIPKSNAIQRNNNTTQIPGLNTTDHSPYLPMGGVSGDMSEVVSLLQQVITHLAAINGNTGNSTSLLELLNEKDFQDKGLRDSLSKLKDVPKKTSYARHSSQLTSGNRRAISAMARP